MFCARDNKGIQERVAIITARNQSSDGDVVGTAVDVADRAAVSKWLCSMSAIDIVMAYVSALSGKWEDAIASDLRGTLNVVEKAEHRIARRAITYVGSKASSIATPGFEAYGAIKAATTHYVKSNSARLAANGVRVNVVSPGDTFVEGGFWDGIRHSAPEIYTAALASNPLRRLARPEEIARVIAFISSPIASFVVGANWRVDGGSTTDVQF